MQLARKKQAQISCACQPLRSGLLSLTLQTKTVFIIFKLIEKNDYKHVYSYQETDFQDIKMNR